jgi:hypothetical protein
MYSLYRLNLKLCYEALLGPAENGLGFQLDAPTAQAILKKTGEQMEQLRTKGYYPLLLCPENYVWHFDG